MQWQCQAIGRQLLLFMSTSDQKGKNDIVSDGCNRVACFAIFLCYRIDVARLLVLRDAVAVLHGVLHQRRRPGTLSVER